MSLAVADAPSLQTVAGSQELVGSGIIPGPRMVEIAKLHDVEARRWGWADNGRIWLQGPAIGKGPAT